MMIREQFTCYHAMPCAVLLWKAIQCAWRSALNSSSVDFLGSSKLSVGCALSPSEQWRLMGILDLSALRIQSCRQWQMEVAITWLDLKVDFKDTLKFNLCVRRADLQKNKKTNNFSSPPVIEFSMSNFSWIFSSLFNEISKLWKISSLFISHSLILVIRCVCIYFCDYIILRSRKKKFKLKKVLKILLLISSSFPPSPANLPTAQAVARGDENTKKVVEPSKFSSLLSSDDERTN